MIEKIKKLKERYQNTEKEKELKEIRKEMNALFAENPDEFTGSMIDCMKESNQKAEELLVRQRLEDILPIVSVSYLAKNYFKKTPQWFYQRLNGNKVNGKEANFSAQELKTLSSALQEIGQKLTASASLIF
jgi:hypothetical protein